MLMKIKINKELLLGKLKLMKKMEIRMGYKN
jgi:hypothetical protein